MLMTSRHGTFRAGIATRLFAFFLCAAQAVVCGAAPNIFDDDWTPPKPGSTPVHPAEPAPVKKPGAERAPVKPADETGPRAPADAPAEAPTEAPSEASVAKPAAGRRAIPGAAELARSRAQMKELFAGRMADRSMPARRALAQALLEAVPRTADNPTDQYVLLGGAIKAAREGASARLCFSAADEMAKLFKVDALPVKAEATLAMPLRADSPVVSSENAREGLELLDELIDAEDFGSAAKVAAHLRPSIPADSTLAPTLAKRTRELETLRLQRERVVAQLAKLKRSPDDPAANLFVGSYYCFGRGDWATGLALLAKGSDVELRKLAAEDLREAGDDAVAGRLGDAWWKVGERQGEALRAKTWQHAASFYRRELPGATGLRRTLVEKRIANAGLGEEPGRVNLFALLASAGGNAVKGTPKLENGVLTAGSQKNLLVEFPYVAPDEYDYSVTFRAGPSGEFLQIQPCPGGTGRQFSWRMGAFDNKWSYFEKLESGTYGRFGDKMEAQWMAPGERYTCVIKVRRDGVEAFLNDKRMTGFKTDYTGVSLLPGLKLSRTDTLGLQIAPGFEVEAASVVEVTGQGKVLKGR
jgi:hypothetical protein